TIIPNVTEPDALNGSQISEAGHPQENNISAPQDSELFSASSFFTKQEETFLHLLLEGADWRSYLSERHIVTSVFIDAINDKIYDVLGDSVIELEGKNAVLIEDYREDLLELLGGIDN
ncbi:MAG: hypothetical protein II640_11500, partial [Lachnospiraceae bacterium]|nr:hypothetical protein [Lachnospiraceae bacterium]